MMHAKYNCITIRVWVTWHDRVCDMPSSSDNVANAHYLVQFLLPIQWRQWPHQESSCSSEQDKKRGSEEGGRSESGSPHTTLLPECQRLQPLLPSMRTEATAKLENASSSFYSPDSCSHRVCHMVKSGSCDCHMVESHTLLTYIQSSLTHSCGSGNADHNVLQCRKSLPGPHTDTQTQVHNTCRHTSCLR